MVKASQQLKFCGDEITPHSTRNLEDQGIPFFVWFITFEPSSIRGPISIYITAGIAVRIILPCKPHHYAKAETPLGRPDMITPIHIFLHVAQMAHNDSRVRQNIYKNIYVCVYIHILLLGLGMMN